jgi:glycosyltransferase involved in cell wall biosynthesis
LIVSLLSTSKEKDRAVNLSPSVTVVIPLYNGAEFITRSVKSVLGQTYADFELIVVDDGSKDGGGEIVREFKDSRLRMIRQENAGASAARNKGIDEGKGKYFAFLDADDEWDVGFLDAAIQLATAFPQAGIYGTGYRMIHRKGPVVEITAQEALSGQNTLLVTDYFTRASGGSLINASGVVIPRSVFEEVGLFQAGEHYGEDLEMWSRIALHHPLGYDTRVLFSYHQMGSVNKIRFNEMPRYEPHVRMLQTAVANRSYPVQQGNSIKAHIRARCLQTYFWFVSNSTRAATLVFVQESQVRTWRPILARIAHIRQFWPFLKLAAYVLRLTKSRLFMRALGGQRVAHGVLSRLVPR